ncbi:hypothetical protein BCR32DRAFT_269189 [Anaeromyces robustus]|uniref:DUF1648 domain-containing protein n=1 Tax=Anaeromyces robustus TaxID=1754192 RepID=A0A1Y1X2P2_9FUNG|nr:hypothetical protein BCR32DRAFT_269189 [Anaeromyces robustus]|eukprot:ORX79898.1 hypothetical protein BCR32DRAFT_269189 [Anaeromyces robustus]
MGNLSYMQWLVVVINFLVIIFEFIYVRIKWNSLPDEIPVHFNFDGEIDKYGSKSTLYLLPSVSLFETCMFLIIGLIPEKYWTVHVGVESVELPTDIRKSLIRIIINFLFFMMSIINGYLLYTLICMIYIIKISSISLIIFLIILVLSSIALIYFIYKKVSNYL